MRKNLNSISTGALELQRIVCMLEATKAMMGALEENFEDHLKRMEELRQSLIHWEFEARKEFELILAGKNDSCDIWCIRCEAEKNYREVIWHADAPRRENPTPEKFIKFNLNAEVPF